MPEALPPASTTIRPKVNSDKFMGSSFAAGKKLQKRVETNERKITILKNIIKMRQQADGKNKIGSTISGIAASVESLSQTVEDQHDFEKDQIDKDRKDDEKKKAKKREGVLEGMGAGVKKTAEKIMAPIKSMWDKLMGFITVFALGAGVMKLIDWMSDKENHGKVQSIMRFLSDWWPAIVAGLIAFLPGLLGPAGVIIGVIALLAWAIPKIIGAVKAIFGMNKDADKIVGKEGANIGKESQDASKNIEKDFQNIEKEETPKDERKAPDIKQGDEKPSEIKDLKEQPVPKFAKGGIVQGPAGVDKVPAKLTSGEFVMSKGAVEKYGAGTLAGMNAAAGSGDSGWGDSGGGSLNLNSSRTTNLDNNRTTNVNVQPTQKIIPYEGKEYRKPFNTGGKVVGRGGEDKVPAKLTAGEFVMSKSAVNTFGADTFSAMNASGGGTNVPVEYHFKGGGLVQPAKQSENISPPDAPIFTAQSIQIVPVEMDGGTDGAPGSLQNSKIPNFGVFAPGGIAKEQTLGIRR